MGQLNELQGAFICAHCAKRARQIMRAVRSEPVVSEDSGWQFLCTIETEDETTAHLWTVGEVLTLDPSLKSIIESPPGAQFQRLAAGDWQPIRLT